MKKLLIAVLVAGASTVAFADSFQEFNNNVYAGYNNTSINEGQAGTMNSWTLGSTIQTKNNIWINLEANDSVYMSGSNSTFPGSNYTQALITGKAGYAFQLYSGEDHGFQLTPYVTYTYGATMTNLNQYYGIGLKPEYRFLGAFKASVDMTAYDATQDGQNGLNAFWPGQAAIGFVQDFRYTINPEIQYDIAKTIMLAGGYKYDQSFNSQMPNDGNSTVYVKVGYLF
jgi:hypothetical protein